MRSGGEGDFRSRVVETFQRDICTICELKPIEYKKFFNLVIQLAETLVEE